MAQGEFNIILKEKIANIILYLTRGEPTPFVKILKLLYLTDELAVMEEGAPITWLQYNAWERGPVPVDVHEEFERIIYKKPSTENDSLSLSEYIDGYILPDGKTQMISPKKAFSNNDISQYEKELLDKIISMYGDWSVTRLVDKTHDKDSLWSTVVRNNNLKEYFKLNGSQSNYPVDFSSLIDTDYKKSIYVNSLDSLRFDKYF